MGNDFSSSWGDSDRIVAISFCSAVERQQNATTPRKVLMEDTKNQQNGRKCNCSHKTSIPTGLSLPGESVFFNDLSESECFTTSSRGEDEMRAFSFAKPLLYWIFLFFNVHGWEVSAVWWNACNRGACVERVFMN